MDRSDPRALMALRLIPVRPWWLAVLAAVACSHSEPFQPAGYGPDGPLNSTYPRQLTFEPDPDRAPSRAADGGWLYSYTDRSGGTINTCLAGLPSGGGGRTRTYCDVTAGQPGVNSTVTWAAESPDGRLAYFRTRGVNFGGPQTSAGLIIGSFAAVDSGRVLRSVPYNSSISGRVVRGISHLNWLDSHTLLFVATQVDYRSNCQTCGVDTLEGGLQIERIDVDHPSSTPDVMPGTTLATSVQAAQGGGGFYFTLAGDSRVYHRDLASGVTDTVFDFGAGGVVRDIQKSDSLLYVIVGGSITQDSSTIQVDQGGFLKQVDLSTGTITLLTLPVFWYRHPALASDGRHVLAELAEPDPDLFLFEAP